MMRRATGCCNTWLRAACPRKQHSYKRRPGVPGVGGVGAALWAKCCGGGAEALFPVSWMCSQGTLGWTGAWCSKSSNLALTN